MRGGAAHLVHRRRARVAARRARAVPGARHPALVALRGDLPSGARRRRRLPLRERARRVHPRARPATGSTSTSPPTRNTTRRRAAPQDDLAAFKRKVDAGADSAITQYFYNADAYWHFVDACRGARHHGADRSGHHADRQLRASSRASPTPAAPRFRAGSGASSKATATTRRRSARSGSTWSRTCATACSRAARRACTSTR